MAKRKRKQKGKAGKYASWLVIVAALVAASYLHQIISGGKSPAIRQLVEQGREVIGQAREDGVGVMEKALSASDGKAQQPEREVKAERLPEGDEALETPKSRETDTRVMNRTGYTLSFNDEWLMPNWVAWRLTPERVQGKVKRSDAFTPDPHLPEKLRVEHRDYSRSGYDRGHMAPAADMKWDELAMQESFYMSNMCPQAPNLNKGDWKELEEACREWAEKHRTTIYIACGPIVKQGKRHKRIGQSYKVTVPDGFFKVVMKQGKQPAAVGFIFPNDDCNAPLESYAVTVDSVETLTGIDFFHLVPDEKENALEAINGMKKF